MKILQGCVRPLASTFFPTGDSPAHFSVEGKQYQKQKKIHDAYKIWLVWIGMTVKW